MHENEKLRVKVEYLKNATNRKGVIKTIDKYELIFQLSVNYSVKLLCQISQVSRSGYYKRFSRKASPNKNHKIKEKILEVYIKSKKIMGIGVLNSPLNGLGDSLSIIKKL